MAPELRHYDAKDGSVGILFLMATEAEYGPALQKSIVPLITGVGPVEAAIVTTACLAHFSDAERPDLVISLGSAGSSTLPQGGIYQVSSASHRDMDASPLGFEKGVTPFSGLPATIPVRQVLDDLPLASISSGGDIVNGERYLEIDTDMVDMETYAHMRAVHYLNIPLIGLRGISDGTDPIAEFSDWTRYLSHIDRKLADVLAALPAEISRKPQSYWGKV